MTDFEKLDPNIFVAEQNADHFCEADSLFVFVVIADFFVVIFLVFDLNSKEVADDLIVFVEIFQCQTSFVAKICKKIQEKHCL